MKKISLIGLILIACLQIGCQQDYITLSGDLTDGATLTFYADDTAGSGIGFRTTGPWQVTVSDTTWLKLNPVDPEDQKNKGGHFIKFGLNKYLSGVEDADQRSCVITISDANAGEQVNINVVQLVVTKAGKQLMFVNFNNESNQEHISYANVTEGATISMETADSWTATVQPMTEGELVPDWMVLLQTQGNGTGTYELYPTLRPNLSGAQRKAKIVIRCKEHDFEVPYTQEAHTAANQMPQFTGSERTTLVYMLGNSNSKSQLDADISEMLTGIYDVNVEVNNLLVYVANGSTTELFRVSKDNAGKGIKQVLKKFDAARNSVDPIVMQDVFSLVADTYPAENNGLVLWLSQNDWLTDDANALSILNLKTALSSALPAKLDYILFDSNFMQSVEVPFELRQCADYFIGTPAEIPTTRAKYTVVVPAMFQQTNPTDTLAVTIARRYFDSYAADFRAGVPPVGNDWSGGVALSVVDGSQLDHLATQTAAILQGAGVQIGQIPPDSLLNYDHRAEDSGYVGYYDFGTLVRQLQLQTAQNGRYEAWLTAYKAAVLHPMTTAQNYSEFINSVNKEEKFFSMQKFTGLAIYKPGRSTTDALFQQMEWHSAAGWATIR